MRRIHSLTLSIPLGLGLLLTGCGDDEDARSIVEAPTCDATCVAANCQSCEITGDTARCVSLCGPGLTCEASQCTAPEVSTCDGGCAPCEVCDLTGDAPQCRSLCGADAACVAGVCESTVVVTPPAACDPACGDCEVCDVSGDAPVCVSTCGAGESCLPGGQCVRDDFHANLGELQGSFEDGPSVTAVCLDCHPEEAQQFMHTSHWRWRGRTPNLQGHETGDEVGKKNLVNNFCVSVPGNEARCSNCHAGYGYSDSNFDFEDPNNIDCLVCHADPASGYKKATKTAGRPEPDVDLGAAARSVGLSDVANCGSCHFDAGGGDNVKKGDLGSALVGADIATDVHMGIGVNCSNCHVQQGHVILGQGVHTPNSEGRLACEDCHTDAPHAMSIYNEHSLDVACQTCHVPAFSRQQPTKTWWDWSSAGNRTRGNDGIETTELADGTIVQSYNYMKGEFIWEKNIRPEYAWYDGRVSHMTLSDSFPSGAGMSEDNPINLAGPLATYADDTAKIFPFKVMRGRQPAHLGGRFLIAPKLFGPGGFWPQIPAADAYDENLVRALWSTTLTTGARLAGQLGPNETIVDGDWDFLFTEMYLGINHEVAPKSEALGQVIDQAQPCQSCHFNDSFPWIELGYSCDPITNPAGCGARHYGGN